MNRLGYMLCSFLQCFYTTPSAAKSFDSALTAFFCQFFYLAAIDHSRDDTDSVGVFLC